MPSFLLRHVLTLENSDSHPANEVTNDVFFYHIPETTLNLYIKDVGSRLPFDDIEICLQSLGLYILREITTHGDGPSMPRKFRYGIVFLEFDPIAITWIHAGDVADALEHIISNDNWTWATHITVGDTSRPGAAAAYLNWGYRAPGFGSAPSDD
ncbi:MAG: hypothetical protein Q9216_003479, partial [Gyalolechia sp. 2 TL-2023]